jgi:ABC-3C biological conflict system middle component
MILPTKGLALDRALLSVGAEVLRLLDRPKTVSRLWDQMRRRQNSLLEAISYDWFLLSLDLLYLWGAVDFEDGRLRRHRRRAPR